LNDENEDNKNDEEDDEAAGSSNDNRGGDNRFSSNDIETMSPVDAILEETQQEAIAFDTLVGANCPAKQTLFESSTRDIFVGGDPRDWTYAEASVLENAVVKTHNSLTYICTTGTIIIRYLWDAYAWQ